MSGAADRSPRQRQRRALLVPVAVIGLAVLTPLTALIVTTWLAGWRLQPVITESMAPAYPAGSLLAVQPVDPNDVKPGTVIVFADQSRTGRLVAHRVTAGLGDDVSFFRTKGDANAEADPFPVDASALRGRVRWSIAGLGSVAPLFRWPLNAIVLMGIPALLFVATELRARGAEQRAFTTGAEARHVAYADHLFAGSDLPDRAPAARAT